jgi:ParB-like chromosome segregation protein Spo0J
MTYTLNKIASDKTNTSAKRGDAIRVRLDAIHVVDGFNVRAADDELREHVASIAGALAAGFPIPPIEVFVDPESGRIELVDGHCRVQGYHEFARAYPEKFDGYVDAMKFDGTAAQRKARIATSNSQLKLKAPELGRLYLSLRDEHSMSRQDIAGEVGKSVAHVDQMMLLVSNAEVAAAVERNEISATEAVHLVRDHGENAAQELERRKEVAKELGKDKVTAKVAAPKAKAPSRPKVDFVTSCAVVLVNSLGQDLEKLITDGAADPVAISSVSPDLLADLITAVREMQQANKPLDADQQEEMEL